MSPADTPSSPRVGIALGGGGITGIAWLVGALEAVRVRTGWDPATADVISGTSAGAVAAAMLSAGLPARSLLRFAEDPAALDEAIARAGDGRHDQSPGPSWPGSLLLGATGLLSASPRRRVSSLAGFLPRGHRSTDEIRGLVSDATAVGWPKHTELWLHACDYRSGRRVTFGRAGNPAAALEDAVTASCAVPGYYRPISIGGRRYVDGGLHSFTNADAFLDAGCDTVVVLSPFATAARGPLIDTALYGAARQVTAFRLRREVKLLRESGVRVIVIEPTAADLAAMGLNPMERRHSRHVLETASESMPATLPPELFELGATVPQSLELAA